MSDLPVSFAILRPVSRRLSLAVFLALLVAVACSGGDGAGKQPSSIQVGPKPWAVAVNEDTRRLYAANEFDNTVTVADLDTEAIIATLTVGTGPNAAAVNRTTGRVYIANAFSNDVTIIEDDQVVGSVRAGASPWDIAVDEATNRIYVANQGSGADGTVSVIDGESQQLIDTFRGLTQPLGVILVGGALYVADANANEVIKIDPSTGESTGRVAVGDRPRGVAVDANANRLYVTNIEEDSVSVVDLGTLSVVSTISVGRSPQEVAVNPERPEAYVVNTFGDSLSIIDTSNNTVKATVFAGSRPWDVKVSEDGAYIYVASSGSGEINIFTPEQLASASPVG
jgi:YVTN family beta-propeller protein